MKIIVDGDNCSRLDSIIQVAQKKHIPVHIFCDYNHELASDYATIHVVDQSPDRADFAIANFVFPNDIVITNDIGLAALTIARNGFPMSNHGKIFSKDNINGCLTHRHMRMKSNQRSGGHYRRKRKRYSSDYKKRTPFVGTLCKLIHYSQKQAGFFVRTNNSPIFVCEQNNERS